MKRQNVFFICVCVYIYVHGKHIYIYERERGFPGDTVVKNLPASAGDTRDTGLIPGSASFPRVGNGNPLPYSCLENSMDRGVWQAIVHGVTKSQTWLSIHTHTHTFISFLTVLGLHCCVGFSLVVASRGYSLAAVHGLVIAVASLVEHGSRCMGFNSCTGAQ